MKFGGAALVRLLVLRSRSHSLRRPAIAAVTVGTAAAGLAASCRAAPASTDRAEGESRHRRSLHQQLTEVPPFDPHASQYEMDTYGGRVLHFFGTIGDLRTLTTTDAEVERCRSVLSAPDEQTDAELWRARRVLGAVTHPETGDLIPAPLRFSFFAPANLVICAGLLRPGASLAWSGFFQWLNQSYNAGVNIANGSSGDVSTERLAAAYCAATGSALAVGTGLQMLGTRLGGGGVRAAQLVRVTVPALAVATGAVMNVLLMRAHELERGVPVFLIADGAAGPSQPLLPLGSSVVAAKVALAECAAARVIWTFGLLTLAPILTAPAVSLVGAVGVTAAPVRLGVELSVQFGLIWALVPLCMAIFPQQETVARVALEPPLRGDGVGRVTFNKGL